MHYQASSMLILQLLLISSTIWKSRGMPIARSLSSFSGVGVTSILPVPNTRLLSDDDIGNPDKSDRDNLLSFYVGTKRGLMKKITMNTKRAAHNDDDVHIQFIEEEETDGSKRKTPYPIFSMMSLSTHHHDVVLSGSGNRYVTIWEQNKQQVPSWRIKAKLGPHTGWVKDLASSISPYPVASVDDDPDKSKEEEETFLFSIGCNCIEVWKTVNGESFDHVHKLMIDSSVEMGSTLSSDILCLATSPSYQQSSTQQTSSEKGKQQNHHSYYLLAGGVDGRIHQWTICNNSFQDATVVCAPGHNGRVNALLVCNDLRAAVSIGNDGLVKCWKLDRKETFMERSVCSVNVNDDEYILQEQEISSDEANPIKLTCTCIFDEKEDFTIIGIGTACGKVLLAEISKSNDDDDATMSITLLYERTAVDGGSTIHSIASQNNNIIIGHSKGISIWEPDLHNIS